MTGETSTRRGHDRDSTEFARVANLSDGVFGIALTLLVLNLVVPGVGADELDQMWRDLVPSLVGAHPDQRAAVLPFLVLFLALSSVLLLFVLRADRVDAWRRPLPRATFRWIVLEWGASLVASALAIAVALVSPLAALVTLPVLSAAANLGMGRLGPDRSDWF